MAGKKDLIRLRKRKRRKQNIIRATIHFFVWAGVAVLYYIGFSVFFDTPVEYELKHSTDRLRREYTALVQRYDTLTTVMRNLSERDRNVFRILFESDPYDFDSEYERKQTATYENIFNRSSRRLKRELRERVAEMETRLDELNDTYLDLQARIDSAGSRCDNIPSIQPVINKQLTLLTASYGMRIHPFYKTLQSHQGVDYTIPEGSRVFATADGTVREVAQRNSTSGQTVVIDHGNGYETSYNHLSKINVRKGQQVRRGDIIALSGDTGLSLAPHLHYEVRYNGMRVDPIHYFFMELSPLSRARMYSLRLSWNELVQLYYKYIGVLGSPAAVYRFEAVWHGRAVRTVVKEPVQSVRLECTVHNPILTDGPTWDCAAAVSYTHLTLPTIA